MYNDLNLIGFDEESLIKKNISLKTFIDDSINENYELWFNTLNEILFTGKYCEQNFLTSLNELKLIYIENVKSIKEFFSNTRTGVTNYNLHLSISYYYNINDALNFLSQLCEKIKDKFNFYEQKVVFNLAFEKRIIDFEFNSKDPKHIDLFKINLFISYCDHFISNKDFKLRKKIDKIILILTNANEKHSKRLKYKSRFIRAKLIIRDLLNEKKQSKSTVYSLTNGSLKPFSPENNFDDLNIHFEKWLNHISDHYELASNSHDCLRIKFNDLEFKKGEISSYEELHIRTKYFKDVEKLEISLKSLITFLEKKAITINSDFNKFSYNVTLTYVINNYFSLLTEKDRIPKNRTIINETYQVLKEKLENIGTKNYFLHYKYLTFLIWEIGEDIEELSSSNTDELIKLKEIKSKIDTSKEIIKIYKNNIKWVKENNNYVFQLPFEECFVKIDDESLFVFSSFVLPIDRDEINDEFLKCEKKLEAYKSSTLVYGSLSNLYSSYKELSEDNKKKDSKNIEILGLFVAIVTFTASVIPGFKFINTGVEAIFFTVALGISMSSFAITLITITNTKFSLNQRIILPSIFVVVSCAFWFFAYKSFNSEYSKQKGEIYKLTKEIEQIKQK